jgi:hypothetical protein
MASVSSIELSFCDIISEKLFACGQLLVAADGSGDVSGDQTTCYNSRK